MFCARGHLHLWDVLGAKGMSYAWRAASMGEMRQQVLMCGEERRLGVLMCGSGGELGRVGAWQR